MPLYAVAILCVCSYTESGRWGREIPFSLSDVAEKNNHPVFFSCVPMAMWYSATHRLFCHYSILSSLIMKKLFLSVLTLAAFTGGIALTSCGGGGGGSSEEDWARCFSNVTIEGTAYVGAMDVQLLDAISYRTLSAVYTFSDNSRYDGHFNIQSMKVEGDTVTITASFGIANGSILNDVAFIQFLGVGNTAKSCRLGTGFGAEYVFKDIENHRNKEVDCTLQGKATFYKADGTIVLGDSNYIDEEDDPDSAQRDYVDLADKGTTTLTYTGTVKLKK